MSTTIIRGVKYNLIVSAGYSGGRKNSYWSVYIDYNQDGDFLDSGELIKQHTYKNTNNTTISFTVPNTAAVGSTRMRVVMSMNSYQNSCSSYDDGETEDYTVVVSSAAENPERPVQNVAQFNWAIFPNPAKENIRIQYHLDEKQLIMPCAIYDLRGNKVLEVMLNGTQGNNEHVLDVNAISTGFYFMRLEKYGKSEVKKLRIEH